MRFPLRFAILVPEARLADAGPLAGALFGDPPESALGNFTVPLRDGANVRWRGGCGVAPESMDTEALAEAPWARLVLWSEEEGILTGAIGFDASTGEPWGWEATLNALGLGRDE